MIAYLREILETRITMTLGAWLLATGVLALIAWVMATSRRHLG